jgi:transcriptional regulator with XRE-family HTH domain
MRGMSDTIPDWGLHHRLARALEWGNITPEEMAATLGVHVNSIYNYASGRRIPKRGFIRVWALRCGVPFDWLEHGDTETTAPIPPATAGYLYPIAA